MTNSIVRGGRPVATTAVRRGATLDGVCPNCGSLDHEPRQVSDTVDFRGLELDVTGLHRTLCRHCGHLWATPEQEAENARILKAEYAKQRDSLRQRHGMLTGGEIAALRMQLGLTQKEASIVFGGGPNSFNKYECGEVLQSQAMDKLIRLTTAVGDVAVNVLRNPQDKDAVRELRDVCLNLRLLYSMQNVLRTHITSSQPTVLASKGEYANVLSEALNRLRGGLSVNASVPTNKHFAYLHNANEA